MKTISKMFFNKRILLVFATVMVLGYLFYSLANITYASISHDKVTVNINIDGSGHVSQQGSLLGKELWYPGKKVSGIVRINSLKGIKISSLGLNVDLISCKPGYSKTMVKNSFLRNMRLKVEKGKLLSFSNTIINNRSLYELVSGNGRLLKGFGQLTINRQNFIDLRYTLAMDEQAGNELESVKASVDFVINTDMAGAERR